MSSKIGRRRFAVGGLLFVLPFVSHYASKGMTALVLVCAALSLAAHGWHRALDYRGWGWLAQAFGLLLLWGAATSPWAVEPLHSGLLVVRLFVLGFSLHILLTMAAELARDDPSFLSRTIVASGCLLLFVVGIDLLSGVAVMSWLKGLNRSMGSNDYLAYINNGIALVALFSWPYALHIRRAYGIGPALAFWALALVAIWHGNAQTPLLSMVCGAAAFLLVLAIRPLMWRALVWGTASYLLLMPLLLHLFFKTGLLSWFESGRSWSLTHRFAIWQFGYDRFLEKPFVGWGLDSSRELPGGHEGLPGFPLAELMPLHPHNSALQVWLELGVPGAVAVAIAVVLVGWRIESASADRQDLAVAAAIFACYEIQSQFSFGTWQNAWLASAIVAAALWRAAVRSQKT